MALPPLHGLALCSGVGGLDLGLRLALGPSYSVVCHVEGEAYAVSRLVEGMEAGWFRQAPVWDDVATFDGRPWRQLIQICTAGFPCQPWSSAGKRKGTDDSRWLWPAIERVLRDVGPGLVFLENVPDLTLGGIEHVLGSLAALGFDAVWCPYSVAQLGGPHLRTRIFILAWALPDALSHALRLVAERRELVASERWDALLGDLGDAYNLGRQRCGLRSGSDAQVRRREVANSGREGPQGSVDGETTLPSEGRVALANSGDEPPGPKREHQLSRARVVAGGGARLDPFPPGPDDWVGWRRVLSRHPELGPAIESPIRGMADGTAGGAHQLRASGNGVVPLVAARAFVALLRRAAQ